MTTIHQRARIDLSLRERLLLSLKWDSLTWDDKLAMVVQLPVTLIRRLTVPVVIEKPDDPQWKVGSLICGVLATAVGLFRRTTSVLVLRCTLVRRGASTV